MERDLRKLSSLPLSRGRGVGRPRKTMVLREQFCVGGKKKKPWLLLSIERDAQPDEGGGWDRERQRGRMENGAPDRGQLKGGRIRPQISVTGYM